MSYLEMIAELKFVVRADGTYVAEFPNSGGIVEVRGDVVRFIPFRFVPYGADESDNESYQLVKI
jgi:hypothetical protein